MIISFLSASVIHNMSGFKSEENMSKEMLEAFRILEEDKGIKKEDIIEKAHDEH